MGYFWNGRKPDLRPVAGMDRAVSATCEGCGKVRLGYWLYHGERLVHLCPGCLKKINSEE